MNCFRPRRSEKVKSVRSGQVKRNGPKRGCQAGNGKRRRRSRGYRPKEGDVSKGMLLQLFEPSVASRCLLLFESFLHLLIKYVRVQVKSMGPISFKCYF